LKTVRRKTSHARASSRELAEVRARLAVAEETLRAIRAGEVDAIVIAGRGGPRVFTLEGADHPYRAVIESMNEGALTLTADKTILYANRCFARMVRCPLEQVIGSSFRRFLSTEDRAALRPFLKRLALSGAKVRVVLNAADGSRVPAQVSIHPLAKDAINPATIGLVVTDMTEARRGEDMLRALSRRLVEAQEAERARLASELHDHVTQLICASLIRSQALANRLATNDDLSSKAALKLREMLGTTAEEVERISRNLHPGVLDHLGLAAVLRAATAEFEHRTGVRVKLACPRSTARLPAETELTLYRILQEALKNVERHARARHVSVALSKHRGFVRLAIHDDGVGFDKNRPKAGRTGANGLGLLGIRERATYVGGTLEVASTRRAGTEIEVRIPVP
jgi:two-component system, NarL family, sensor kinase